MSVNEDDLYNEFSKTIRDYHKVKRSSTVEEAMEKALDAAEEDIKRELSGEREKGTFAEFPTSEEDASEWI